MRKIQLILTILLFQYSFSQTEIDTSQVKSIYNVWLFDHHSKDTTKLISVTEYKSGLFKELSFFGDNKPTEITISKTDRKPYEVDDTENFLLYGIGYNEKPIFTRNYLNKKGIIDSTLITSNRKGFKDTLVVSEKRKNLFDKLKTIKTWEGIYDYNYTLFGKLKSISFKSSDITQKKTYKNGLLVELIKGTKYKRIETYEYNNDNLIEKVNLNEHEYEIYEYNSENILVSKKKYGKFSSGKVLLMEQTDFIYDNEILKREDTYSGNRELRFSKLYEYKNAL